MPALDGSQRRFLAHAALRLSCTHAGFDPLWREQIGGRRVIPESPQHLRAQIDAVIAEAYGLDRAAYEHVLASFSHRSRMDAPELCLAAFDTLQRERTAAFCRQNDHYASTPLRPSRVEGKAGLRPAGPK
jgi:hypothetical protein